MSNLEGKVALITGAARGQGRAVALRLAGEGADIVGVDICRNDGGLPYALGSADELDETRAAVEDLGRKALVFSADVRDRSRLDEVVAEALASFEGIDFVFAGAGIGPAPGPAWEISREDWDRVIETNLTGVWQTVASIAPSMIERGKGGSIVAVSSTAGTRGFGYLSAYVASKHGVEGLVKSLANELGAHSVRVNSIAPTVVNTPLFANDAMYGVMVPDSENPTQAEVEEVTKHLHLLPIPFIEAEDVAATASWLFSDDAKYVTGTSISLDGGQTAKAG